LGVLVLLALSTVILITTIEGKEALKLILESRTEIRRVVWPSRPETTQTTLIVIVAITIAGLILWGLDSLFGWVTASLLG
jgi:preprotein translocase subunit SecE